MSEIGDKRTSRRLKFRRLRKSRNERRGVSPVVATLILILIAVAAAAALYLWLVGWQGSVTGSISKPGVNQGSFTIGGSTSVYPFSSVAVAQYEQNYTGVTISDTQGGTGAGMLAVCSGSIDVGAASTPETAQGLIASDGCPEADASSITINTVAYDAVDIVVDGTAVGGPHGLAGIAYDTLTAIYDSASTTTPTLVSTTMNGATIDAPGALIWEELPAGVNGQSVSAGGSSYTEAPLALTGTTAITSSAAATLSPSTVPSSATTTVTGSVAFSTDVPALPSSLALTFGGTATGTAGTPTVTGGSFAVGTTTDTLTVDFSLSYVTTAGEGGTLSVASAAATGQVSNNYAVGVAAGSDIIQSSGTTGTPCGFVICAGGSTGVPATDTIQPVERSDASGTTQTFEARLLDAASSTKFATSFATVQYTGCGGNNLLSDCGISVAAQENGNPAVLSYISTHPDSIGYASDGLARATAGIGTNAIIPYEAVFNTVAVNPSTGSTGTIANGINAISSGVYSATSSYSGVRPFELVTLQPPTGIVASFISWLLQPGVNTAIATETFEVSVYSV